jgi:hypothetical protein
MSLMTTYETLSEAERNAIEVALDCLRDVVSVEAGVKLDNADHAARAAEALAVYIVESKKGGEVCRHDAGTTASFDHVTCNKCGHVKTDSGWGVAANRWFPSLDHARHYRFSASGYKANR